MILVLLTVHILVILGLIIAVLLQRSEGGALFSGGGFMTGRGTANALTRATSVLAGIFFLTSMTLAYIAGHKPKDASLIEQIRNEGAAPAKKGEDKGTDLLRSLGTPKPADNPAAGAPAAGAPAQPAPTDQGLLDTPAAPATAEPAAEPATTPAPAPAEPQKQPQ